MVGTFIVATTIYSFRVSVEVSAKHLELPKMRRRLLYVGPRLMMYYKNLTVKLSSRKMFTRKAHEQSLHVQVQITKFQKLLFL